MNIFLSILQILGIVLFILVVLFAAVLLYPFFYQAEGELQEEKWVKAESSVLLHF